MTTKKILSTIMAMISDPAYDDPKSERCGRLADDVEPVIGAMLDQLVTHDSLEVISIIEEVTGRTSLEDTEPYTRNDVLLVREVINLREELARMQKHLEYVMDKGFETMDARTQTKGAKDA